MGQRLNLELISEEGIQLNVYYHWSGYTTTTLELAKQFLINKGDLVSIFKQLQNEGARLTEDEFKYVIDNKVFGLDFDLIKQDNINRNMGLIAFSKKGMEDTKFWEECNITINFQIKKVWVEGCLWKVTDIPTILENHEDTINIKSFVVEFSEFDEFHKIILENDYFEHFDEMYQRIE